MAILSKKTLESFSTDDVKLMGDMLNKFHEFHRQRGMPDHSGIYAAYLPVVAITLLLSQASPERLTKLLIGLTAVLALLAVIQLVLILA